MKTKAVRMHGKLDLRMEEIELPEGLLTLDSNAFSYCDGLTRITFPDSVTEIGVYAFSNCGLTSIIIPDSVTMIGHYAFGSCACLERVVIGLNVTYIENQAFDNCYNLKEVNLTKSLLEIYRGAFCECPNLKNVYYQGTMEQFDKVRLPVVGLINEGSDFDCIQCTDGDFKI